MSFGVTIEMKPNMAVLTKCFSADFRKTKWGEFVEFDSCCYWKKTILTKIR